MDKAVMVYAWIASVVLIGQAFKIQAMREERDQAENAYYELLKKLEQRAGRKQAKP